MIKLWQKNLSYLAASMIAQANDLILCGKTSPKRANRTGPTPRAYANPAQMTQTGSKISTITFNVSLS